MNISPSKLYAQACGKFAIGAFNVFTMEQVLGVFKGADRCKAPVIIAITPVARRYASPRMLIAMIDAGARLYPEVVYAVHLDHGDRSNCEDAIASGHYNSVMIDASYESFKTNVAMTAKVVAQAHAKGIDVESELGVLGGIEDETRVLESDARYTDPQQVFEFIQQTRCDSLAIAIGTSHGAYKFSSKEGLRLDILEKIQNILPGFPLVLHGASAVDHELIERINRAGGQLQSSAKGVDLDDLQTAIRLGICKINIATDMRLLWTRVHREFLHEQPGKFDPVLPGQIYIDALADLLVEKCHLLGSADKNLLFQK